MDLDRQIYNKENDKKLARIEMQHQFQKKEDEILAEKQRVQEVAKEKEKRQKTIIGATVIGLMVVCIFLMLLFKRYKITQHQKDLIEVKEKETQAQKNLLEEKNKEITDSIQYAKRIQEAILPPQKLVKKWLPESFIYYKPKDIVAGDFFWMETVGEKVLFAAADCRVMVFQEPWLVWCVIMPLIG